MKPGQYKTRDGRRALVAPRRGPQNNFTGVVRSYDNMRWIQTTWTKEGKAIAEWDCSNNDLVLKLENKEGAK